MNTLGQVVLDNKPHFCPKCGGKYNDNTLGIYKCPRCGYEELDDYGKVRDFLEKNGSSSAITIASETGVSVGNINRFLRQGKIEIPNGSSTYIKCQRCHDVDLRYGRFCPACAMEMAKELEGALSAEDIGEVPKENNNGGKMHFIGRNNFSNYKDDKEIKN